MGKVNFKNFWIVSFTVFVFFGLVVFWIFFIGLKTDETGGFYNKGHNAIWIAHEWAEERKTDREIQDLVVELERHDIDTIYLHVGPLKSDGRIDAATYKETLRFVEEVKRFKNEMKIYAWMGQVRGKLNLEVPDVRRNIVNMAMIFTKMVGMDGVHLDIEPVWDEDEDFIALLAEIREVLDTGSGVSYESGGGAASAGGVGSAVGSAEPGGRKMLSVALAEFIPSSFVWWVDEISDFENYNTEINYLNVAKYADQIVDMVYDTGIDHDWLYKWLVKEQVIWVTDLVEGSGTEFLVGIPAYEEGTDGFNPEVENVGNALIGVINGLNDIRASEENFTGVAVYAEWEMSVDEWRVYDGLWLE